MLYNNVRDGKRGDSMVVLEYLFNRLTVVVVCVLIAIAAIIVIGPIVFLFIKMKESNWYSEIKGKRECKRGKHTYKNGNCRYCGRKAPEHTCVFVQDFFLPKYRCVCKICKIEKQHQYVNHKCQYCGSLDHDHELDNFCQCSICGKYFHKYENGKCRSCGAVDPEHEHSHKKDINGKLLCICEICGQNIHEYENGKCGICGEIDPAHTHVYEHGKCIICCAIDPFHEHICTGKGRNICKCDICGEITHCYENEQCVRCGKINPNHLHKYIEGKCVICQEIDPYHEHVFINFNNSLAKCKICGKYFSLGRSSPPKNDYHIDKNNGLYCEHRYQDGRCVICGKTSPEYSSGRFTKRHPCSGYPHNCYNCSNFDSCRFVNNKGGKL